MYLTTDPLHVTYAKMSDKHRLMATQHGEDAVVSPEFSEVRLHNARLAELHSQLSIEYAMLSAVHQEVYNESRRK